MLQLQKSFYSLLVALTAYQCSALPALADTYAVVPENFDRREAFANLPAAEFIQQMNESGATAEHCKQFAEDTIKDIKEGSATESNTIALVETGAKCAAEGQNEVTEAQEDLNKAEGKKAAKDQAQQKDKENVAAKCTASVDLGKVYLDELKGNCYDYTKSDDWGPATEKCKAATEEENAAIKEQKKANTDVADKKKSLQTAKTEAASLEANCLCSAYMAQTEAKAAPAAWTKSQLSEWKRAHEILCAVDQKEEACVVPPFPAVELPEDVAGATDATHCVPFVADFLNPLDRAIPLTSFGGTKIPECNNNVQNPLHENVECQTAVREENAANFYKADPVRSVYAKSYEQKTGFFRINYPIVHLKRTVINSGSILAMLGNSIDDGTSECTYICTALGTKISTEWTPIEALYSTFVTHGAERLTPTCASTSTGHGTWHRYEYGKMNDGTVATQKQLQQPNPADHYSAYQGPKSDVQNSHQKSLCQHPMRSCDCNGILKVNSEWKQ